MSELVNLSLDLRADSPAKAEALRGIENAGFSIRQLAPRSDDAALAWIDEEFGGSWSGEAFAGTTIVVQDRSGQYAGFVTYDPKGLRFRWLRGFATESGVGIFGPLGVASKHRGRKSTDGATLGQHLVSLALAGLSERGHSRALIPAVGDQHLIDYYERHAHARIIERFDKDLWFNAGISTVVMASGNGSNFQSVLDKVSQGALPLRITALVCNRSDAYAIERARRAGIAAKPVVWDRKGETREHFDERLARAVQEEKPALILLLGWMHLFSQEFVEGFSNVVNIHPAFLPLDQRQDSVAFPDGTIQPAFRGANSAHDALHSGASWVGATAHRLSLGTDRGSVLVRKPLRVAGIGAGEEAVMERLHRLEHEIVAAAIRRVIFES